LAFCQKRKVFLSFFAEDAENDLKTGVTKTTLSFAMHFWQQRSGMLCAFGETGGIENFKYLGKFEKDCRKCWLYCV
jgi:hypothetical protein